MINGYDIYFKVREVFYRLKEGSNDEGVVEVVR